MTTDQLVPTIVVGARGRMGKALIREIVLSETMVLEAAVDREGGPGLGQDAGRLAGLHDIGLTVVDELRPRRNSVVVDFSLAHATDANIRRCVESGVPLVLGTTGLPKSTRDLLRVAARDIAIVSAANFSVGVTLLTKIAGLVAGSLGESWDAELLEIHHSHKRDAPSGTALRIAKAVAKATGRDLDGVLRTDRADNTAHARQRGEIGIAAVRGGDSIGEHTLMFLADGERLELTHRAFDRAIFARGALRAGRWVAGMAPGLYTMADVIGLGDLRLMRDRFDLELVQRSASDGGETATFAVGVPADLLYFEGHFPGSPLLPGVAQLVALVLDRVRVLWPELGEPTRVGRLKFKQPIAPGDRLDLTLELERSGPAPRVHFQIDRGGQACTIGVMTFALPSPIGATSLAPQPSGPEA